MGKAMDLPVLWTRYSAVFENHRIFVSYTPIKLWLKKREKQSPPELPEVWLFFCSPTVDSGLAETQVWKGIYPRMFHILLFKSVSPWPAASALLGNWLEMQNLRLQTPPWICTCKISQVISYAHNNLRSNGLGQIQATRPISYLLIAAFLHIHPRHLCPPSRHTLLEP